MSSGEWQRIKEVFNRALDLEGEEREGFLRDLRQQSPTLADEVSSLLSSHEDTSTLFDDLPSSQDLFGESGEESLDRFLGTVVGRYRLTDLLGKGGMSSVFLATRLDGSDEQVAIKLLRPSQGQEVSVERFFDERQILAHLHHPNIARLVDGGQTEDGVHYLVMEYIRGLPVDRYCEQQGLDLDSRLGLMRTVCSAVHYAHRNLVVHRDLKPSNILVTAEGVPKLLDFGIAKLLNADFTPTAGRTRSSRAPMTPDFASPEQFLGEPVSTASDVYSLGVLAYQLLTDRSPYTTEGPTLAELARRVCTHVPIPPSLRVLEEDGAGTWSFPVAPQALARRLRGDLDAVVGKALEKNPVDRYPSAQALAEDLHRARALLPVHARGDDLAYVARSWLRRRKRLAAAIGALVIVLSIVLGLSLSNWLEHRQQSEVETRLAEIRALERQLATGEMNARDQQARVGNPGSPVAEVTAELGSTLSGGEGKTPDAATLKRVFVRLEALAAEPDASPRLRFDTALAFLRLAELRRWGLAESGTTESVDDPEGSVAAYRQAHGLLKNLAKKESQPSSGLEEGPSAIDVLTLSGEVLGSLAERLRELGETVEAQAAIYELLSVSEARWAMSPEEPSARRALAEAHAARAEMESELGRVDAAAAAFGRAIELLDALLVERSDDRSLRRRLMELHRIRARALEQERRLEEALVHCRRHLDLGRALPSPTFEDQAHLAEVGLAIGRLETALAEAAQEPERRRRLEMARYQLRHALDQADELVRVGPLEVAESDLLGRLQTQLEAVESRLATYPNNR